MAEPLKIKVTIAGRVYPINVKNENEEEGMRKAAKHINDLVTKFEKNYAVSDKQDVLAMCALQFASQVEQKQIDKSEDYNESLERLEKINEVLAHYLDK